MSFSLDGLASGLNTSDIINQLMAVEKAPQDRLRTKKSAAQFEIKALQALNSKLAALRTAGQKLARPATWIATTATTSATSVATATSSTGSLSGALSFNVDAVAQAGGLASTGTVASTSSVVTSGNLLLATGGRTIGLRSVADNGALTLGEHTIKVTQASAGASKTGTAALAATTTIDATNDTIEVEIDGVASTLTLAQGADLTEAQVASAVQTASNGTLTASVASTGELVLTTVDEGSQATLRVTGGTALTALSLSVDGAAIAGVDGLIDVDGTVTAITDARADATASVPSGTGGAVDLVLSGGLRTGSVTAENVSTVDGTLANVVAAINDADAGMTAAAVQVAPGQFRLQLSATTTGVDRDLTVASSPFAALGSLASTAVGSDATITVGTGPGAYTVTSGSNTVAGLFPGVTIQLVGTGATTLTVKTDPKALAESVKGLVAAANAALAELKALTGYDAETKTAGALFGDSALRGVQTKILSSITTGVETSALGISGMAGVSVTRSGELTFDEAKFLAKFDEDPDAVAALFEQGGIASSSKVALQSATDQTLAGTYDVVITQAATAGEVAGAVVAGGTLTGPETIDVRVGGDSGTVISYAAAGGESLTSIADGLNALLAEESMDILATVEGGALVLRTTGYGTGAKFEVRSTVTDQSGIVAVAGAWEEHAGVNVAGTINGVAASGTGQLLTAPLDDETLRGLTLRITATPADVLASTSFGTFEYVPGVGQRLASVADGAADSIDGTITAAINGRQSRITQLDKDIAAWDTRLALRQRALRLKFTAMETALSNAKNQSNWLAGQIGQLQANSANNR